MFDRYNVLDTISLINVDTRDTAAAKVRFASGCAAPIGIGDQFGSLVVTGYENTDGHVCTSADYLQPPGASTSSWKKPVSSESSLTGTEVAAIVVGCIAAVALIVGTMIIRKHSKGEVMSTHE